MSVKVGIHLSTDEWLEAEVEDWAATADRVSRAFDSGEGLAFGDDLLNPFNIVGIHRGGVPVRPEDTT